MIVKDWVEEAAREIRQLHVEYGKTEEIMETDDLIKVIEKHCPFKRDTAYEEVGEVSRKVDQILTLVKYIRSNQ